MIKKISPNNINLPTGHTLNCFVDNKTGEPYLRPTYTRISHEVPLSMLEMSYSFNDYEYALVHLFKDNPEYFNFYEKSVEMGRMVILDNSLYELGEAFDMKEYAEWIEKLHPTHYIIPDTFWSAQATIDQAMEWMINYGRMIHPSIKKIGVAQGSTYEEIKRCYTFMDSIGCDCIAFTFKFSPDMLKSKGINLPAAFNNAKIRVAGYEVSGEDLCEEDKQAITRYMVLRQLAQDGVINPTKEHHLLGLQNTTALRACCSFPWVTSIDTSNPIINGFCDNIYYFNNEVLNDNSLIREEYNYIGNSGLKKPTTTLADVFDMKLDEINEYWLRDIMHNVQAFREVVNPSVLSTISIYSDRIINDGCLPESIRNYKEIKSNIDDERESE